MKTKTESAHEREEAARFDRITRAYEYERKQADRPAQHSPLPWKVTNYYGGPFKQNCVHCGKQINDQPGYIMKRFIECKDRRTAARRCPWAGWIVKAEGGYWCFEYFTDYQTWKRQR